MSIYNLYLWFKPNLIFRINLTINSDDIHNQSDGFKITTIHKRCKQKAPDINKYRTSFFVSGATTILRPF